MFELFFVIFFYSFSFIFHIFAIEAASGAFSRHPLIAEMLCTSMFHSFSTVKSYLKNNLKNIFQMLSSSSSKDELISSGGKKMPNLGT
jgi:hypothetical protein